MEAARSEAAPTPPESALLVCVAALGRALDAGFEPRAFLDDFSAALQPLVPHDRLRITHLTDDRRTVSVFAEGGGAAAAPTTDRYTTDLQRVTRFPATGALFREVFDGAVVCVPDLSIDERFVPHRASFGAMRSAIMVPLTAGSRVVGQVSVASGTIGAFSAVHVERMRRLGRLTGPFIETVALLYRDRRRRHRLDALTGITQMIGTTLDVREILGKLGEAVRPAVEFDAMGVILFKQGDPEFRFFGAVGEPPVAGVEKIPLSQFSYAGTVMAGLPVLFDEASNELDPAFAGDGVMLTAGYESCLWVPMHFGDEVAGTLFFGKHEPYWYDSVDVDVATVIANRLVLAIQHQRLAEEQRRFVTAERRAQSLERSLQSARRELHDRYGFEKIIGRSPVLREALTRAAQVARTETTVLITGESGTGKELVARAIHFASSRADGPFVAVNCAALSDTLLESELFGHERGAFTGADRQKPGRFELAAHGTLFLDEIGELSSAVQVKLLRVLQEREFQRVGGTATIKADVRLIAATNRDLAAEIAAGRFRSDLFYRLNVFNVHLPALRQRGDDVLLLADVFIRTLAAKMGRGDVTLSRDALEVLRRHPWPGNIRELQNAIERGLITCEGTLVTTVHLAMPSSSEYAPRSAVAAAPPAATAETPRVDAASESLEEIERNAIIDALTRTRGQKSRAAALLGLTRFQLYTRLKRLGIDVPRD
jgi:transcriptional regulator with GAF, ATPase, and Fis domain